MHDKGRVSQIIRLGNRVRVPLLVVALTAVGLLTTARFPTLIYHLALPPAGSFRFQNLYGVVTYPLAQPSLFHWFSNSVYMLLGCWLLNDALNQQRQWAMLVAGLVVGALIFEFSSGGSLLAGSSQMSYSIVGGVLCYGFWKWRSLPVLWRAFVVCSAVATMGLLTPVTPATGSDLASAGIGWILTWRWAIAGASRPADSA